MRRAFAVGARSIVPFCFAALVLVGFSVPLRAAVVTNPISAFPVIVDGTFTSASEWSDVTPVAFISSGNGSLTPTTLADPSKNSLLYAALAPGTAGPQELYLMYDYASRTSASYTAGNVVANISFPLHNSTNQVVPITVELRANGTTGSSFFDVFVNLDSTPSDDMLPPSQFGIEAFASFGNSPMFNFSHLMVELEVGLKISTTFSPGVFPGGVNPNGTGYSPDQATWNASASKDVGDPPISSAIFTINPPSGSTTIVPLGIAVPLPASAWAGMALLVGLAGMRRLSARR